VKQTVGNDFKFLNFKLLNVLNVIIGVLMLQYVFKFRLLVAFWSKLCW